MARVDTGRELVGEAVAPAPADGKGAHVHPGPLRQGMQRAPAEDTDSGQVLPEQRRGIQRDAEARLR
ncbi:MAG TPA: hypothetical protein VHD39_00380 [Acidimicrobiales bacterium]|nr:hypothetical protein [Acidimicrobiales bacterium]